MSTERREAGVIVRERYGLVLLLLGGGYLLSAIEEGPLLRVSLGAIWTVVILAVLWAPGLPPRLRAPGAWATIALLFGIVWSAIAEEDVIDGIVDLVFAAVLVLTLLSVLARVASHDRVRLQTVAGAIAAYAMLAVAMASVYRGVELLTSEPLLDGVVSSGDYVYFSFVTLTTLGFGDITPLSDVAKRLVVIEAFAGQVFLVTLVARLVSMWGQPLARGGGPSSAGVPDVYAPSARDRGSGKEER